MKVAVDINILLDALLKREPHAHQAAHLLTAFERGIIAGHLCAASVDTLYYLLNRASDQRTAKRLLTDILGLMSILPVNDQVILAALQLGWTDLEDAIIHESARLSGMDAIITRDKGFSAGTLPALTATEVLAHPR
ncbi:type II toxin-antitoxin system VapC family toxin [Arhodomonas sp. AD133]|uniref:type II toxin-antitoxin system VapC family toxin n=1 Tax=Arhodomonas sp. AD133 TaxID=3415009 RepID=UPI003EBA1ABA